MDTDIEVAVIGLVGVFVGATITSLKEWWLHRIARQDAARYLSALLISKLDKLCIDCSHLAGDSGEEREDGYYYAEYKSPRFELPTEDADWTTLSPQVQLSLLNLPYRLESIDSTINNEFEHDSPPDFAAAFQQRRYLYAKLGIEAYQISDQLRRTFGFPHSNTYDWNPIPYLEDTIQRINQLRQKSQKIFDELSA